MLTPQTLPFRSSSQSYGRYSDSRRRLTLSDQLKNMKFTSTKEKYNKKPESQFSQQVRYFSEQQKKSKSQFEALKQEAADLKIIF
jgi:hypothetical protein